MDKLLILAGIFLIISILSSMLGIGGGVLYLPILLIAGYSMRFAPSISLLLILGSSLAALLFFYKQKMVDWKLALVIDPPTDIMAFVGGYFSSMLPETTLKGILALILIIAGILMLKENRGEKKLIEKGKFGYWHRTFNSVDYVVNLPLVLTATAAIGLLSGMLGITGGIIKLPIMVLLCGVPMDVAVATSMVMVAVTAISGLLGHGVHGNIDWQTGLILAIVAIIGGTIGSRISIKTDKGKLKKIFAVVVLLMAANILYTIFLT